MTQSAGSVPAWDIVNTLAATLGVLTVSDPLSSSALSFCPTGAHRGVGSRLLSTEYQDLGSCGTDTGRGEEREPQGTKKAWGRQVQRLGVGDGGRTVWPHPGRHTPTHTQTHACTRASETLRTQ